VLSHPQTQEEEGGFYRLVPAHKAVLKLFVTRILTRGRKNRGRRVGVYLQYRGRERERNKKGGGSARVLISPPVCIMYSTNERVVDLIRKKKRK